MGGGSDREQGLMYRDLISMADGLWDQIEQGFPVLCICGAYQLLGSYYRSLDGQMLKGLGLLGFYTQSEKGRLIGNILIEIEMGGQKKTVVGFENHGGRTYMEDKQLKPLGKVLKGFGNNGKDGREGIWHKNLIGTYLHGPLLPKNPALADYFIRAMASRRGLDISEALDDRIEDYAHHEVKRRLSK
jgi:CobQ-like glutamine amidotransferase family enzyme